MQVLKGYNDLTSELWEFPYVPIQILANKLKTSKYQIRKAYKNLEKEGYMEKTKIPSYCEDYYNGLYDVSIVILEITVFDITLEGQKKAREL